MVSWTTRQLVSGTDSGAFEPGSAFYGGFRVQPVAKRSFPEEAVGNELISAPVTCGWNPYVGRLARLEQDMESGSARMRFRPLKSLRTSSKDVFGDPRVKIEISL
ncbi:hypothetical protein WAI453_009120 [Rhynchosporium graminicola]